MRVALSLAAAFALLATSWWVQGDLREIRKSWGKEEAHVWVPPPAAGRFLSVGYNELLADLFWTRTLIYYGGGLFEDSSLSDVDPLLALVNALDPRFRRPYIWGAYATTFRRRSATQEEYRASVAVLERAIRVFPDDWELHWILGVRLFLDIKSADPEEQRRVKEHGAAMIERAMRLPGAPEDLGLLAATMRTKLGQRERALHELHEMILITPAGPARDQLEKRYAALGNADAAEALAEAARAFDSGWLADLPYVPPSLYVLVGPPAPAAFDLGALAGGETFAVD